MTTDNSTVATQAAPAIARYRARLARAKERLDKLEPMLVGISDETLEKMSVDNHWVQFSSCSHEQAVEIMRVLRAGKWKREVTEKQLLEYTGVANDITFIIYNAAPPSSCQIIEERVEVPAHVEIRRTLKCA